MARFYLQTFGCQMNKNDSERIVGLLDSLNITETKDVKKADIIIVNTCSVRQSAEDRVFGYITNWQKLRKKNKDLIIVVTGCMPGRDLNGKIKKRLKGVDLFFGIEELVMLPKWLRELNPLLITGRKQVGLFSTTGEISQEYLQIIPKSSNSTQSFVTIQTGCNNFCTYCVVPYARGREKNRPLKSILDEIKLLVKNECLEVILLGQVVNNYKISDRVNISKNNIYKDKDDFATLLWEINQIKGLKRINYTAADPQYFSDYQVESLNLDKMANNLHLPVQSGDNDILKNMNRKYTRGQYIELVKKIRKSKPDISLSTDFIIGFAGETDKQFNNTIDLYKKCDFDISFPAKYSERSGTVAAKVFNDNILLLEKKKRWQILQDLMESITLEKNKRYLNKKLEVVVEECENGICSGHSSEMKLVQFWGDKELIGSIVDVKINWIGTWLLKGILFK